MEKIQLFFANLSNNFREFWSKQTGLRKGIILSAVASVLIGLIALLSLQETNPYEYVFVDLAPEDQQAVSTFLKNANVDFIVDAKGIKVPSSEVLQHRIKLAQEGLPAHGVVGWEKFDSQDFTRTEFEQRINKQRAIQGELSRTIMMIEGVASAKVHIVTPKKSLFLEESIEPTAAVYLKTKRGFELDKKQIKGIVHLVSRSVEGLKPENVTILDGEGKMVTEIESDEFTSKMTKEMLAYKRSVEKQYEENVRGIVGRIVGGDRVEVKVDAVVDFTQEQQTISDVDPERSAILSRETQGYQLQGTGLNPTGIPGAKSNVPGEQEQLTQTQSSASNKKDSELVNFEVSKKVSQRTLPVGKIVRLTTAVLVDGKQEYPKDGSRPVFEARTEEEIKQIEDLVRTATGFDEKRGDSLAVRNMMFQLDPIQIETINQEKKEKRDYISTLSVSAAVALALVLFFAFVVRPYLRWLAYDPAKKQEKEVIEEYRPDLDVAAEQSVKLKDDVTFDKLSPQEQVLYLAQHEPKRTTEAIRLLLNPQQTAG